MRVRPRVTYEAVQFDPQNPHPATRLVGKDRARRWVIPSGELDEKDWDEVQPGGWILEGQDNRFFAVSQGEFERLYEIVEVP